MKILLTGATGYIGKRLLPILIEEGHEVVCAVRDLERFHAAPEIRKKVQLIQLDLLQEESMSNIPKDIDGAYYLVHSMSTSPNYDQLEKTSAVNFRTALEKTDVQHLVYLGGIANEQQLSEHLSSRLQVEKELAKGKYHFTGVRAGIIIGSGSASFEIIRDLVEKLPVMITPKWLRTKCQPIGITDVIGILAKTLFFKKAYDASFDIGGPNVLSYRDMLLTYAKARKLKRWIGIVPVMTPKLSSYWLYFVTSTSFNLASALVDSMKIEVVCRDRKLQEMLGLEAISYPKAIEKALSRIQDHSIPSSWKDSFVSSGISLQAHRVQVPEFGCFVDQRSRAFDDRTACIRKIWRIGGDNGWYYGNWLWKLRGYLDKLVGGVGLRRGRTNPDSIHTGDALDFWRVLYADKRQGRLILFAEMKLPGEAWLEFKIAEGKLIQTATFRPKGVLGRMYWYAVLPFHGFIFDGMLKALSSAPN